LDAKENERNGGDDRTCSRARYLQTCSWSHPLAPVLLFHSGKTKEKTKKENERNGDVTFLGWKTK